MIDMAIDTVLPPRCPISHEIVERQGTLSPQAWGSLRFISAPFCVACGVPLEIDVGKDIRCAICVTENKNYDVARAALVYDDASRSLILGFKHGDQTQTVVSFIPWLFQAGREQIAAAEMIMPVPLHRWRLLHRRYNQSALIARALGRASGKTVIQDGLIRTRATPTQGHLKAGERTRNVRNAFAVREGIDVNGKNILVIDDVYTTGSTVSECARALKDAGAATVNVLTLARTVKPGML